MERIISQFKNYFIPHQLNGFRPQVLERRSAIFLLVVFIGIEVLFMFSAFLMPRNGYFADISSLAIFNLVNQDRTNVGFQALSINDDLNKAAAAKARDMIAKSYFSHVSPQGVQPWYLIQQSGYDYLYAGENLARGFVDANSVFNAWMNSPDHRANILNSHYTDIGIAVVSGNFGGKTTTFVVQMFGSKSKEKPAVPANDANRPTPVKANKLVQAFISNISGISRNFFVLGLIFVGLVFLLNLAIHARIQHRDLILNGLIVLAVVLGLLILNSRLVGLNLQIKGLAQNLKPLGVQILVAKPLPPHSSPN